MEGLVVGTGLTRSLGVLRFGLSTVEDIRVLYICTVYYSIWFLFIEFQQNTVAFNFYRTGSGSDTAFGKKIFWIRIIAFYSTKVNPGIKNFRTEMMVFLSYSHGVISKHHTYLKSMTRDNTSR
jgi:hypothetical protein